MTPKNSNFQLPNEPGAPSDLFKYIADFNSMQYFETDINGVVVNEIDYNLFMVNRIDTVSPRVNAQEYKYDGVLFIGIPSEISTDVDNNQFDDIMKDLLSKSFLSRLKSYIYCSFEFSLNNIKPLYNSNKYTKSVNSSGIEVNYSLWL